MFFLLILKTGGKYTLYTERTTKKESNKIIIEKTVFQNH